MRLFDLHSDTLYECYTKNYPLSQNSLHIDLARGRAYRPYGQVFAVWVPEERPDAWDFCRAVLSFARTEERRHAGQIHFWRQGESLDTCVSAAPCTGILAVEGGAALGGVPERVDELAALGVKLLTLTWNGTNRLGNGCLAADRSGLTAFGCAVVRRLHAAAMVPDVSHLNKAGFWDVAEVSGEAPFVASHSNAAAVCAHPRNLTDAQAREIMRRGGLIGLNWCAAFLGETSFAQMERHLAHFLSLGGERTVCMGGDWDGTALPPTWGGIEVVEAFFDYLCRKNYDSRLLDRLFFGNCYDFLKRL